MKKGILFILCSLFILLMAFYVSALDNPHDTTNNITCDSCHFTSTSPAPWFTDAPDPLNPDTNYAFNRLCWSCHNDVTAPSVMTHSEFQTTGIEGWSKECRTCHHPHFQRQFRRWGSASYLYSSPSTAVTTNTITRTGAGWTPNQWQGMLVVGNILVPNFNYRIASNTADTLTVEGTINTTYVKAGNTFAIVYGRLVKDVINARDVRFYRQTGPNSFADGDATYDGVCEVCHTVTAFHRNNPSGDQSHNPAANCMTCHSHRDGMKASCNGCHDSPPNTGSHVKHFGGALSDVAYGSTSITQDFTATSSVYIMNCGNCHPLDLSFHNNGSVDVELYNALSPAGSLKAKNPASASYTPGGTVFTDSRGINYTLGTCNNVYCHSYNDWTTPGGVPEGTSSPPANLVTTRYYRTVTWGNSLTCSGCHGNPTTTSYPANDGGSGDSHQWIDNSGYGNLHMFNHGFAPISCRYCHNDTVRQVNTWSRNASDVTTMGDVPIYNNSKHVNGTPDVAFDTANTFPYNTPYSLAGASYNSGTKTCSNVSCHRNETSVIWGTPYRWYYSAECNRCHGY